MRYVRIDKLDGAQSGIAPSELRTRLARRISLVDEEMARIDHGAVWEDEHAWYQKELVMGLRGTLSQNILQQAEDRRESYLISYGNSFYEITPDGMEHFADFGAEVCAAEMTSDEATYRVLLAERVEGLTPPGELDLDTLGALCGLTNQAQYFTQSIISGELFQLEEIVREKIADHLLPAIRVKIDRAQHIVEELRSRARATPRLIELRKERETLVYERLRVAITALLLRYDTRMMEGVRFFNRTEWNARGEEFDRDSLLTMTYEGNLFYEMINGGETLGQQLRLDLENLLESLGYGYEPNINWSLSVFPRSN